MPGDRGRAVGAGRDQPGVRQPHHQRVADLAGEQRRQPVLLRQFLEARDLGAAGDPAGEADGRAAQDEQAGQRHDERRQAGPDHDRAVDVADQAGDGEREQDAQPQRPAPLHRGNRDDHPGGADHRADRQVELAADHQHRGGDRDDAELRRDLEEVDDAGRREQAAVAGDRREEEEHQNGPGDGAELRSRHQPLEQRRRGDPFVDGGLDRCHANPPHLRGFGVRPRTDPGTSAISECPWPPDRSPARRSPG